MATQLCYEDVAEGMAIPLFEKVATSRAVVMHLAAYEDFAEIHHDKDAAQKSGFPTTIVPGLLTSSFVANMLTNWITPEGTIKSLKVQYRRPYYSGETIICKGKVTAKRVEGKDHLVECEVWAENAKGESTTPGTAVIALPSRRR